MLLVDGLYMAIPHVCQLSLPAPSLPPSSSLLSPSQCSESGHQGAGGAGDAGKTATLLEGVHRDTAVRQEPMLGREGERGLGRSMRQSALQAGRLCRERQVCFAWHLYPLHFPSVRNSPPLGAQKLRDASPRARRPQGRRSGMVLSLP